MGISEKIAYLKGLMEGMNVDTESNEGKLFAAVVDVLDEIALERARPHRRRSASRRWCSTGALRPISARSKS